MLLMSDHKNRHEYEDAEEECENHIGHKASCLPFTQTESYDGSQQHVEEDGVP